MKVAPACAPSPRVRTHLQRAVGWLLLPLLAHAGAPAWEASLGRRAVEENVKPHRFWAGSMTSKLTVFDGANRLLGSVETDAELKVANQKPKWTPLQQRKTGSPGMMITMDIGIQSAPEKLFDEYTTWSHVKTIDAAEGRTQVWQGVSREDPRNTVVLQIGEADARPRSAVFSMPYKSWLGTQHQVELELYYRPNEDGIWLPWRSVVDQSTHMLLFKRRIRIETLFRDWIAAETDEPARVAALRTTKNISPGTPSPATEENDNPDTTP